MKIFFTFLAGFLICCILGVVLYNVVGFGVKDITALKPITYYELSDPLLGNGCCLEFKALGEDYKEYTVIYRITTLDGGSKKVSIVDELNELYTEEELLKLKIDTGKTFYISFKENIYSSLSVFFSLVQYELNNGTVNPTVNATNLFNACYENGTKMTNYSITFDIQQRGQNGEV